MNFRFDRYVQNHDISDNGIEFLNKTSLKDLGVISLVQLNASRNYIREIDEEAFLGQTPFTSALLNLSVSMFCNCIL